MDGIFDPEMGDTAISTGYQVWETDGTATGTVMVRDINPGAGWGTGRSSTWSTTDPAPMTTGFPLTLGLRKGWR